MMTSSSGKGTVEIGKRIYFKNIRRYSSFIYNKILNRLFFRYSAKTRSHLKKKRKQFKFVFVCFFVVLRPSQQLWLCRDGQLT